MMSNVFSMFDPSTSYSSLNWLMVITTLLLTASMLKKKDSKKMMILTKIGNSVTSEEMGYHKTTKTLFNRVLNSTFICCLMLNLLAILPFNFTPTAHMSMTLYMSMSMWIATMINSMYSSFKKTFIHLTPLGTPTPLMNFMVMIELISLTIRPITLAVRLMANMVAGHLLLSLLSSFSMMMMMTVVSSTVPMLMLLGLETAVAMIQAYVITTLMMLYYKESL